MRRKTRARRSTVVPVCYVGGHVVPPIPDLAAARQRYAIDRAHLAESYRRLEGGAVYPVRVSEALTTLQYQVETTLRQQCHEVPVVLA